MRRSLVVAVFVLGFAAVADANLMNTWQEVQEQLASDDVEAAEQTLRLLQDQAAELEVWRMPAYAAALVVWAESHPGLEGQTMVRIARELDRQYPGTYFLEARWRRESGDRFEALRLQLAGWLATVRYEPTRRMVAAWVLQWAALAVALTLVSMMLAVVLRYSRKLLYDLRHLGGVLFRPGNAWVFAIVVMLLPVFAGLGPVWLGAYLFAGCWIYLVPSLRVWAVVACLYMVVLLPLLDLIQDRLIQPMSLPSRLEAVLGERQMDLGVLREMIDLETNLAETGPYHLLTGELLRMHGEPGQAKVEFQKAVVADPEEARALIFIGGLALEEGDAQRAVQVLNSALKIDPNNAFAYHNLSLAFDLIRRFEEGDVARTKARELAGRDDPEDGLRGLDPRIRFPRLRASDVRAFAADLEARRQVPVVDTGTVTDSTRSFLEPLSLAFAVCAVLGLAVLALRSRLYQGARECSKCGKTYRNEPGLVESTVYCPQCVSVFLKRDVVSIEQQTSKLSHIRRWERMTAISRRLAGLLLPGSPYYLSGQVLRGVMVAFAAFFLLSGALVWVPLYVPMMQPLARVQPAQIAMLGLAGLFVLRSATVSWNRR